MFDIDAARRECHATARGALHAAAREKSARHVVYMLRYARTLRVRCSSSGMFAVRERLRQVAILRVLH